jgi:uncharacterized RDD family membrane protein YckC
MPEDSPENKMPEEVVSEQPENVEDDSAKGPVSEEAAAEQPGQRVPKADVMNRVIARFIDVLIALLLARLPGYIGFMAGFGYLAAADGWLDGASMGKKVIGLRAVRESGGGGVDYRDSILRNSTVCILYALLWVPLVGWILSIAGAGFELLLMIGSPTGKRLGDEIASTVVLDAPKSGGAAFDDGAHTGI